MGVGWTSQALPLLICYGIPLSKWRPLKVQGTRSIISTEAGDRWAELVQGIKEELFRFQKESVTCAWRYMFLRVTVPVRSGTFTRHPEPWNLHWWINPGLVGPFWRQSGKYLEMLTVQKPCDPIAILLLFNCPRELIQVSMEPCTKMCGIALFVVAKNWIS